MKKKIISGLTIGALFMGVLALTPSAQALDAVSINQNCIFFDKVAFHVNPDLTTPSGVILSKKHMRVMVLPGPAFNAKPPQNVNIALFTALCGAFPIPPGCIHSERNTIIDSVDVFADCDDDQMPNLKAPPAP